MRILFVTPEYHVKRIQHVLGSRSDVEAFFLLYTVYDEVPPALQDFQHRVDGVIFAGKGIFRYAEKHLYPEVPWVYLPNEASAVMRALLLIQKRGWDITRVSFDTYSKATIREVYASELEMKEDQLQLQCYEESDAYVDQIEQIIAFHKRLIRQKKVSCCVTRLYQVHKALQKENIPHEYACHTYSTINHQIEILRQLYRVRQTRDGHFAVLNIEITFPPGFSNSLPSNYQFAQLRMKIASGIYRFAELVHGIVIENSVSEYTIVGTKAVLEQVTDHYDHLPLMDWIKRETVYPIQIGIGMGDFLSDAMEHASSAQLYAKEHSGDWIALVFTDGTVSKISCEAGQVTGQDLELQFAEIAKQCGLTQTAISRMYAFAAGWPTKRFTAGDVANELRISKRTADRMLAKMEAAGYIVVSSLSVTGQRGRPSRLLEFSFEKLR